MMLRKITMKSKIKGTIQTRMTMKPTNNATRGTVNENVGANSQKRKTGTYKPEEIRE